MRYRYGSAAGRFDLQAKQATPILATVAQQHGSDADRGTSDEMKQQPDLL
jgi:hypothetical protein